MSVLFFAALPLAAATLVTGNAFAQTAQAPWLVRARAVHLNSDNKDSTGLALAINDKWMPEVDISYFFTPRIAAELVLTIPQKHTVTATGVAIGSLRHLPPTLTAQYHFTAAASTHIWVRA